MNTLELLEIEDQYDVGMPAVDGEYVPGPWKGEPRTDLKPLHITQPEGTSFTWMAPSCGGRTGRCASASTTARAR